MYLPKSEKELRVIKALLEYPQREWTLGDLSEETGVPKTTVWRAVNRLGDRGLVKKFMIGKTCVVEIKNKEVLRRIVEMAFAEVEEMRKIAREYVDELKGVDGVKSCVLFGSVAKGTANFESDIDLLVLVDNVEEVEDRINSITERVSSKKSVRIMPDVMKEKKFVEMERHGADFARKIRREGMVLYEAGGDE